MATEINPLFEAVGRALEKWGTTETQLAQLFEVLSDMPDTMKAHRVFDAVISFEARIDMLNALMAQESITELEHETWNRCAAKLRKQYQKRHELAHFSLVSTLGQGTNTFRLSPFLTYGRFVRDEARYLDIEDINSRKEGFDELGRALTWFYLEALVRRGKQHQGIPMQAIPLVAHFRELAIQILEERARKQQGIPHK